MTTGDARSVYHDCPTCGSRIRRTSLRCRDCNLAARARLAPQPREEFSGSISHFLKYLGLHQPRTVLLTSQQLWRHMDAHITDAYWSARLARTAEQKAA